MPVVIHLLTVEAALLLQTAERLTQLLKLRPSPLTVQTLLANVLRGGDKKAHVKESDSCETFRIKGVIGFFN